MNVTNTRKRIMNALPFVFCFCFLLMSGTALAQKVTVDYDKDADFSKYKTYAFGKGTPAPETLMDQRIREAIATQLAAKGLTKVESNADLFVVYHCAIDKQTQLDTTSLGGWGWGGGWRRWGGLGGGDAITRVEQIPVGTLIVDIGDMAQKRYIWRGTATKTESSNPQKNEKTIDEEVRKMFEKFPPPAEKK
jgi:hypothetical protein